jgi:lipopolysaccharide transport system ATP-binding protein
MYVRLAFAVAAHLEPEILVVDEVLAVGDAAFQKKCLGKMGDVASKEGRTVLFVSHNMAALSSLCNTGVFLEKGKIKKNGDVQDCVNAYLDDHQDLTSNGWRGYIGNEVICLTEIVAAQNNLKSAFFVTHQETTIRLVYKIFQPIEGLIVAIRITSFQGNSLAYARVDDYLDNEEEYSNIGEHFLEVTIPANLLAQGKYIINIDMGIHNIARIVDQSIIVQFVNTEGIGRKYLVSGIGFDDIFRPKWIWKPINFNSLGDA